MRIARNCLHDNSNSYNNSHLLSAFLKLLTSIFCHTFAFCLFDLMFNAPVNSYGHVETVSSLNHTFSWASLTKRLKQHFSCGSFFSVLCLLCLCVGLFICALWSPAGKGLTSWFSFVVSNCGFVTFPLVSWVRCGT